MKLRYFVVAGRGQLTQVRRTQVEALWRGWMDGPSLGGEASNELRLLSVLCDEKLLPKKIYLLRLPLTNGFFTRESYLTLRIFSMPDCVTPQEMIQHHTEGWPHDVFSQLAVALDVPRAELDVPLGIGGPLLLAAAMRVSPRKAIRYLK
jgi:hypothetical protein